MKGYTGNGTLGEVMSFVEQTSMNFKDVIVPSSIMEFENLNTLKIQNFPLGVRPTAKKQICARLSTPMSYLEKCPQYLQQTNLNYWLRKLGDKELLVRLDGTEVRAIFTTRYQAINHPDVVGELIGTYGDGQKVNFSVSDDILAVHVPNEQNTFEVSRGDRLVPGVTVVNSETGYKAFSIESYLLRLVCTNGLIAPIKVAQSKFKHIIKSFFNKLDLKSLIECAGQNALEIKIDLQKALATPAGEIEKTFEKINKRFLLTEKETEATNWGYEQEPGDSMYHIINAYTKGAQYPELPPESTFKLQTVGGAVTGLVK